MNVFAKFDKIPSMTLQVIKQTKRHGHTFVRTDGRTDNVKTVYPPTNTVCGGYNKFDKIPSMTLQDIKQTKRHGHTFVRTDGQRENSIPSHKHSLRGV